MSPQEVMCLDEPFSALDALTRSDMRRWSLDIWEDTRRSVLMITHHIEEAPPSRTASISCQHGPEPS